MAEKLPKALYKGKLPIGNLELECAVLDNDTRILTKGAIFRAFGRTRRGWNIDKKERLLEELNKNYPQHQMVHPPIFLNSVGLIPLMSQNLLKMVHPLQYADGNEILEGYDANILFEICNLYLEARRAGVLNYQPSVKTRHYKIFYLKLGHSDKYYCQSHFFSKGEMRGVLSIYKTAMEWNVYSDSNYSKQLDWNAPECLKQTKQKYNYFEFVSIINDLGFIYTNSTDYEGE